MSFVGLKAYKVSLLKYYCSSTKCTTTSLLLTQVIFVVLMPRLVCFSMKSDIRSFIWSLILRADVDIHVSENPCEWCTQTRHILTVVLLLSSRVAFTEPTMPKHYYGIQIIVHHVDHGFSWRMIDGRIGDALDEAVSRLLSYFHLVTSWGRSPSTHALDIG